MSKQTVTGQILAAIQSKRVPLHLRDIAQITGLSISAVKNGLWRLRADERVFVAEKARVKGVTQQVRLYSTIKPKSKPAAKEAATEKMSPETLALLARTRKLGGPFGILIAQLEARHGT